MQGGRWTLQWAWGGGTGCNTRHHVEGAGGPPGVKGLRTAGTSWRAPAAKGGTEQRRGRGAFPAARARPAPRGTAMPGAGGDTPREAGAG